MCTARLTPNNQGYVAYRRPAVDKIYVGALGPDYTTVRPFLSLSVTFCHLTARFRTILAVLSFCASMSTQSACPFSLNPAPLSLTHTHTRIRANFPLCALFCVAIRKPGN